MKVLTSCAGVNRELLRLITECETCRIAVAWASTNFKAHDLLLQHRAKIDQMIVGTHFFQTNPEFIENFLNDPKVRFIFKAGGVFHPKVYFFWRGSGRWECLIGSPNFTRGGFGCNDEIAVLISEADTDAPKALDDVTARLDEYWGVAKCASEADLHLYRAVWNRKQPLVRKLHGDYGNPFKVEKNDKGNDPGYVADLALTWDTYFNRVRSEPDRQPTGHSIDERLKVIRADKELFAEKSFSAINERGRRRIAGLETGEGINFLWFGSMVGAGFFQQAINTNNAHISRALDFIPSVGSVSRQAYFAYVDTFKLAFPNGGHGIGTATRLLTMKRPDYFLCLNDRNRDRLCSEFGIKKKIGYEEYWDSVIERIKDACWWNSLPPIPQLEKEVWEARAAFLDALYYDGKDMPMPIVVGESEPVR
jgi:hypothetical protein